MRKRERAPTQDRRGARPQAYYLALEITIIVACLRSMEANLMATITHFKQNPPAWRADKASGRLPARA